MTLSSSEAEFVAVSQAGQEVVYLRALLRGFGYSQVGAVEIWEDNASCIMISKNRTNRDRSRHVDVRVHFLRDLVRWYRVPFSAFYAGMLNLSRPIMTYAIKLPTPFYSKKDLGAYCAGG